MPRHVIGMSVRDKPSRLPAAKVDRQIGLRQLQTIVVMKHNLLDFPNHQTVLPPTCNDYTGRTPCGAVSQSGKEPKKKGSRKRATPSENDRARLKLLVRRGRKLSLGVQPGCLPDLIDPLAGELHDGVAAT